MTEQPPSTLSIWDFTAAVYEWDFHNKQLYSVSLYIWKREWSLKALLGRRINEDKEYFRLFPPGALSRWQYDDFVLCKCFKSTSSSQSSSWGPPVRALHARALTAPSPRPAPHHPPAAWRGQDLPSAPRVFSSLSFHKPSLEMFAFV